MLPEAVHRPEPCGPRGRVATRCTSVHVTSTTQTPPACAPRTRSLAGRARGQLGPHGGAVLPVHTPAVGEPVDEEQPVAAAAGAGPAPLHLAVAARIVHLDANRPVGDLGAHPDHVLRGHFSVAQGVRDELAEQQPDVLQRVHGDPRREPPRDLAARGRGRCGHRTKGHLNGVHLRSTTRAPTRRTRWRSASALPCHPAVGWRKPWPARALYWRRAGQGFAPRHGPVGREGWPSCPPSATSRTTPPWRAGTTSPATSTAPAPSR